MKVPPLAVFSITCLLMWGTARLFYETRYQIPLLETVALLLSVIGGIFGIGAILSFIKARTTISPSSPEKTTVFVSKGLYNISRNPMYLGLLLVILSFGCHLANPIAALIIPLFPWYMTRYQILPEEEFMLQKFGDEYRQYQVRVRRWL